MTQWLENAWTWFMQPEIRDKVLVPLALAGCFWVLKQAYSVYMFLAVWIERKVRATRSQLSIEIERYQEALDDETFRIQHPWMKEGQSLDEILVPVAVASGDAGVEEWPIVLAENFRANEKSPPRLVVIGHPGSGKSIALRAAARTIWTLGERSAPKRRIPVLLTFSDYRRSGFELLQAVIDTLRLFGFQPTARSDGDTDLKVFVEEAFASGRVVAIIDALDELKEADRIRATQCILADLKKYRNLPAIISCRTAAWRGQLSKLQYALIEMASFSPAAIERFVRNWSFELPKSARELLETINSQPHLGELARSPLMLTIIAFLYGQPKFQLPQNRALFYEECTEALLHEWDQTQNLERANRFDPHHKRYVLCELAYRHMCSSHPDGDMDEQRSLETIADVMEDQSLKVHENRSMLTEIRENSGLLYSLPPRGLRFPHQTFLEFFAALYLRHRHMQKEVIRNYENDPQRWREVLLLYIGLCRDVEEASQAIRQLLDSHSLEIAVAALTDARLTEPALAEEILRRCEAKLEELLGNGSSLSELELLISHLGLIASDSRTTHSETAGTILQGLLNTVAARGHDLPSRVLEGLLLACMRQSAKDVSHTVIDHIEKLKIERILPQMGPQAFLLSTKILGDPNLPCEKKLQWIDGLRRAQAIDSLLELILQRSLSRELECACVVALIRLLGERRFRGEIETWPNQDTDANPEWWGWKVPSPNSATHALLELLPWQSRTSFEDQCLSQGSVQPLHENRRYFLLSSAWWARITEE